MNLDTFFAKGVAIALVTEVMQTAMDRCLVEFQKLGSANFSDDVPEVEQLFGTIEKAALARVAEMKNRAKAILPGVEDKFRQTEAQVRKIIASLKRD